MLDLGCGMGDVSLLAADLVGPSGSVLGVDRDAAALVFEIPLLFETGGEGEFDKVIVVSAPPDVQRARVLARSGMTEAKLTSILDRQTPDEVKRRRADFVVDTGADLSTTESQVREILACLGVTGRD